MEPVGLSVGAADAAPFWRARLDELVGAANLRALVWDGLDSVWLSDDARVNGTNEQAAADLVPELGAPSILEKACVQER